MVLFTQEQLHEIIPRASDRTISIFYLPLLNAMEEFEINTKQRISAFLAQVAHESGSLHYVEEIASGKDYEHRADLGNLNKIALDIAHANYSTTGVFYKGRGLIQLTGYFNYNTCGEALDLDLTHHPKLLCEPVNAARSAAWYFNTHNCNCLSDVNDFSTITRKINGGLNGYSDRLAFYTKAKEVLA